MGTVLPEPEAQGGLGMRIPSHLMGSPPDLDRQPAPMPLESVPRARGAGEMAVAWGVRPRTGHRDANRPPGPPPAPPPPRGSLSREPAGRAARDPGERGMLSGPDPSR